MILDARLQYYGNDADDLDFPLYGDTEEGAFLAWRPGAGAPWVEYPDYEWQGGALTNGSGIFKVLKLRKGQYAFAKGDVSVGIEPDAGGLALAVFPNPASEQLTVRLEPGEGEVQIFDAAGRKVGQRLAGGDATVVWDVSDWAPGVYVAVAGHRRARFVVER
mgnify:CR=1 FL=1